MAAQNNLAISQSQFAAESSAVTLVSEKEKRKQQEELAHLASVLKAVEEELAGAKTGVGGKDAPQEDGNTSDEDQASAKPSSQSQFAAESSAVTLVSDKERKKQREELAHLVAVLKAVEEELAGAKTGVGGKAAVSGKDAPQENGKIVELNTSDENQSPAQPSLEDALAEMTMALQMLQVKVVEYGQQKASFDQDIAKAQTAVAKANLNKTLEQIQKLATESFWEKLVSIFVAIVSAIAAVVTMNPELLVITVLAVLAATGALSTVTGWIADGLEEIMPPEVAKIVASIVVAIIVIICTFGAGAAADAALIGSDVADVATTEAVDVAGEAGSDAASTTTTAMEKVSAFLKFINPLSRLSTRTNTMIMAIVQATTSTGMINNIADGCMSLEHLTYDQKKKIEEILSMVVAALSIVVSVCASAGAAGSAASTIKNLTSNSRTLAQILNVVQSVGRAGDGGANVARGVFEKQLADITANMALIQTAMQMSTEQTSEDQKNLASIMKNQGVGNQSISKIMAGEAAFANLLTAHSPV